MKLLFVAGHGRCDETVQRELPPRVSIKWYGQQGNPLTKGLTKQIMGGAVASSATTPALQGYVEHYTCQSVMLENEERARAWMAGPWDSDCYLVQAMNMARVPLSEVIREAQRRWVGETIEIHWSVCRSSVRSPAAGTHSFVQGEGRTFEAGEKPAVVAPPGETERDAASLYMTQWNRGLTIQDFGYAGLSQGQLVGMGAASGSKLATVQKVGKKTYSAEC